MKSFMCFMALLGLSLCAISQSSTKQGTADIRTVIDSLVVASRIEGQLPRAVINMYLDRRVKVKSLGALTNFAFDSTGIRKGRITVCFYLPGCNDTVGGCWSSVHTRDAILESDDDLKIGIARDFVDDWKSMNQANLESVTGQWLQDTGRTQLRKTIGMRGDKYFLVIDTPSRLIGDYGLRQTGESSFIRTDDSLVQYFISPAGTLITKNYPGDGNGVQDRPFAACLR